MNLGCSLEFFDSEEVFLDKNILFNSVVPVGLKTALCYSEDFYLLRDYEYLKLLFMLTGKIREGCVSKLVMSSRQQYQRLYKYLNKHVPIQPVTHPGGPCLPGIIRLFVTVDGRFFPCERVDETSEMFCIGSLDTGFDLEKMINLLNNGKVTEEECISCWNLPNCKICSGDVELGKHKILCKQNKIKKCTEEKDRVLNDFYELCILHEMGYEMPQEEGK